MSQLSKNAQNMLNDQAVIRWVYPTKAAQWLSHLMEIPLRTARHWADQAVPVYRREEFGRMLLEEYYRQEAARKKHLLPAILKMAGLAYEGESVSQEDDAADTATNIIRALQARVEAAIDWLEE